MNYYKAIQINIAIQDIHDERGPNIKYQILVEFLAKRIFLKKITVFFLMNPYLREVGTSIKKSTAGTL